MTRKIRYNAPPLKMKKMNTHNCLLDTPEYVECTESSEGSKGLLVLLPALQLQISFAVKKRSMYGTRGLGACALSLSPIIPFCARLPT